MRCTSNPVLPEPAGAFTMNERSVAIACSRSAKSTGSTSAIVLVFTGPCPFLNPAQSRQVAIGASAAERIDSGMPGHELIRKFTKINPGLIAEHRPVQLCIFCRREMRVKSASYRFGFSRSHLCKEDAVHFFLHRGSIDKQLRFGRSTSLQASLRDITALVINQDDTTIRQAVDTIYAKPELESIDFDHFLLFHMLNSERNASAPLFLVQPVKDGLAQPISLSSRDNLAKGAVTL